MEKPEGITIEIIWGDGDLNMIVIDADNGRFRAHAEAYAKAVEVDSALATHVLTDASCVPARRFVPSVMVTGRSVFSRSVTHGTPSTVVSSCTPPESVSTMRACAVS